MSESHPHIVIIGAGQLGSRHLQGLAKIDRSIDISIIDPNQESLNISRTRFQEMPVNELVHSIRYLRSIQLLHDAVTLAIIATNSDVRRTVIEELLIQKQVRYIILEKVAFQSVEDFQTVITWLEKNRTKAWVNCPRRMYPYYKNLREKFVKEKKLVMLVEGGNWGLACNAIHMLDLFAFLCNETNITLDNVGMERKIYQNKRKGFIELGGKLEAKNSRGDLLMLIDNKESNRPTLLQIVSENHRYLIFESMGKAISQHKENNWEIHEEYFTMPLQSELTYLAVQQILDTGNSNLTHINESFNFHKPMINVFNDHFSDVTGKKFTKCPIT